MVETVIRRVAPEALLLAGKPLRLLLYRLRKGQRLPPVPDLMVVVRQGAVNRVSEQRDELGLRQQANSPLRGKRVRQVVRRSFEGQGTSPQFAAVRETATIPADRLPEMKVEVVNFLRHWTPDVRVPDEIVEE